MAGQISDIAATSPQETGAAVLPPGPYPSREWVLGSLALARLALGRLPDPESYEAWWHGQASREGTPVAWRRWPSATVAEVLFGSFAEAARLVDQGVSLGTPSR
jgi:hypothetical protein